MKIRNKFKLNILKNLKINNQYIEQLKWLGKTQSEIKSIKLKKIKVNIIYIFDLNFQKLDKNFRIISKWNLKK